MNKLNYCVYQTTNDITGEKYIGTFSYTNDSNGNIKYQNYIGSGIIHHNQAPKMKHNEFVANVIEYGYDNFTREDLLITQCPIEANQLEEQLVNIDWINSPKSLNNKTGGKENFTVSQATKKRLSDVMLAMGSSNGKKVIDTTTGETYLSLKQAAKALNINYSTLYSQIRTHGDNHFIKFVNQ